jgi:inorganic pyrophosphatase
MDEELLAFVEIPKGSRNKYEYSEEIGHVILDRFLSSSMVYPTDYGYLIGHRGRDGDPLDAMVCVSEPTFPGCVILVRPIAVFRMRDDKGEDDKVLCVPRDDPNWSEMHSLDDLPDQLQTEIEHFFSIYKMPEGKTVEVDGWYGSDEALESIARAKRAWERERIS